MRVKVTMPTMDAEIGVSHVEMPVAIQKLSKAITDFTSRAPLAALSLHTIAHACQSIFGLRAAQIDIANMIFANVSVLNALNTLLCSASEPAVMPRDVEDLKKTIATCCVALDRIQNAEDRLGIHLSENFFEEGQRPVARYNAFEAHEKDAVLAPFKKCQEQAVRLLMYAQRHRLEKNDKRTDTEESELICLDAAVETFTGPVHDSAPQENKTAQALPGPLHNNLPRSRLRDVEQQQTHNENTWSIVCPNPEDHLDLERTVPSGLLDTPASSRASTPDVEPVEKPLMADDNANTDGSNAPAKRTDQKPPKESETIGALSPTSEQFAHFFKKLDLTDGKHLVAYILQPKIDVANGTTTWSYIIERLSLDREALAEQITLRASYDSVLNGLTNLLPAQISRIQEHTKSLDATLISIKQGREIELVSPMGTMRTKAVVFVIRTPATKASGDHSFQNSAAPSYYYEEKDGVNNKQQYTTITFSDRHRGQDRSLEEIRLADYQAGRTSTTEPGAKPYPWEPVHQAAASTAPYINKHQPSVFDKPTTSQNPFSNPTVSHGCWGIKGDTYPFRDATSTTQAGGLSSGKVPSLFDPPPKPSVGIFEQPNSASQNQNTGFRLFETAGNAPQAPKSLFLDNSHARSLFNNGGSPLATHLNSNPYAQGNTSSQVQSSCMLFGPNTHVTQPQNQTSGGLFNQTNHHSAQRSLFNGLGSGSGQANNAFLPQPGTSSDDVKNVPKGWQPQLNGVVSQPHPFLQATNNPKPHSGGGLFGLNSTTNTTGGFSSTGGGFGSSTAGGGLFGNNNANQQNSGGLFGGVAGNTSQTQNVGRSLFGQPNSAPQPPIGPSLFGLGQAGNSSQTQRVGGGLFGQPNNASQPQNGPSLFAQPNEAASPKPAKSLFAKQDATEEVANKSEEPTTTEPKDNGGCTFGKPAQDAPPSRKRKDPMAKQNKAADVSGDIWKCKTCSGNLSSHFRAERDRGACDFCQGLTETECWLCAPKFAEGKDENAEKTEGKGKDVAK